MELTPEQNTYLEDFGRFLEESGLPRMVGRVYGILLLNEPHGMTAEELADSLKASRGSISTATRLLLRLNFIERISQPGSRRDHYIVRQMMWSDITRSKLSSYGDMKRLAERGMASLPTADAEAKKGLEDMKRFFEFMEREVPKLLDKFEKEYGDR